MRQSCAIAIAVTLTLFIILFPSVFLPIIIALNSRPIDPTCQIQHFNLAVNASAVFFDISLMNTNHHRGIHYDAINLTILRGAAKIANATFPGFYQGFGKSTRRVGSVALAGRRNLSGAAASTFRVELKTAVRFRNAFREEKRVYDVEVGADVEVNGQGELVEDDDDEGIVLTRS